MPSRVRNFAGLEFRDDRGALKQGHEFRVLSNFEGHGEIGLILRWKDGRLNDDGDLPAVEFQDFHIEHFQGGLLHREIRDGGGRLQPAIISGYGDTLEYYINGKQVQP